MSVKTVLKKRCAKALFILGKIANNAANGIPQEWDEQFRVKYHMIVHEYLRQHDPLASTLKAEKDEVTKAKRTRSLTEAEDYFV